MKSWFWVAVGAGLGAYFTYRAMMSANLMKRPPVAARVQISAPEATKTPLKQAMDAIQQSADRSAEALAQVSALQGALESHNDNDPKLDTEMRNLTPETKSKMIGMYRSMAREKRNDRGMIAFLIGREINRDEDLEFLEEVLAELPCLSLSNCETESGSAPHADGEVSNDTTLIYPQLVSLRALGEFARTGENERLKNAARVILERVSRTHSVERIRNDASQTLAQSFPSH